MTMAPPTGAELPEDPSPPVNIDDIDSVEYNAFVQGMELGSIDVVQISAERRRGGHAPSTRYEISGGWNAENTMVSWRFEVVANLISEDGIEDFGAIHAAVVVGAVVETMPSRECIEFFGGSSASRMAHPFLREIIASTALRLGFTGVLLPMAKSIPESQTEANTVNQ